MPAKDGDQNLGAGEYWRNSEQSKCSDRYTYRDADSAPTLAHPLARLGENTLSRRTLLKWLAAVPAAGGLAALAGCAVPGLSQSGATSMPGSGASGASIPSGGSGAHNLAPPASNQWYSSLYKQFPSEPLFALPAAFQATPQGLGIGLPDVRKTPDTVFASYVPDLVVGFSAPHDQPRITALGDWSVGLAMSAGQGQSLAFTLAHGVPFTTLHLQGSQLQISGQAPLTVRNHGTENMDTTSGRLVTTDLAVSVRGHTYLLAFDRPTEVSAQSNILTLAGMSRVFLAALDRPESYNRFKGISTVDIVSTRADYAVDGQGVTTTYRFEATGGTPLITLYPHHQASLQGTLPTLGHYASVRGDLALVQAGSFTTRIAQAAPPATFPALPQVPDDLHATLAADITNALGQPEPGSRDYFLGVWFGDLDNLLQIAQVIGETSAVHSLQGYMQPKFASSLGDFKYDPTLKSVIATAPEFGNEQLNDHHFHYGYFIRTAAILGGLDPGFLARIRDHVSPLVQDIATDDRSSARFPYLRTFDTYEGHSWASGWEQFADGNNQESSSEAIQAWYAIALWGATTGDTHLANLGRYLYAHEVQSTLFYWFGRNGLYTAPYQHAIGCIVWGGKVDFATWFSAATNMKYGIEILPLTPGSGYLGTLPSFAPYAADYTQHGGNVLDPWGDLFLVFQSFYDPASAFAHKDELPPTAYHLPRSVFLYMLYKNHYGAR